MTIADKLGYEKLETTWNTYGYPYPNKRIEEINKLESLNTEEF